MKKLMIGVLAAVAAAVCGAAEVSVYVDATRGNDLTGDGSWDAPYATIRQGLVAARTAGASGSQVVVSVQPGTYDGPVIFSAGGKIYDYSDGLGYADRSSGRWISLRGRTHDVDNDDPTLVTVTGRGVTNCVMVSGTKATVANLTVTNGRWGHWDDTDPLYNHSAAGFHVNGGAVVSNCVARDISVTAVGAAKFIPAAAVLVRDAKFVFGRIENCSLHIPQAGLKSIGGVVAMGNAAGVISDTLITNCWAVTDYDAKVSNVHVVNMPANNGTFRNTRFVDLGITNTVNAANVSGQVVYWEHAQSILTNCVCESFKLPSGVVGVCCAYGGRFLNSTVTNMVGLGNAFVVQNADKTTDDKSMSLVCNSRIVGNKGMTTAASFSYAHVYDCVVENNETTGPVATLNGGTKTVRHHTNTLQRVVIRNNRTSGDIFRTGGTADTTMAKVEGCWILDNTSTSASGKCFYNYYNAYVCEVTARECVIAGNTAAYGLWTGSRGLNWATDWPGWLSENHWDGFTIAGNTLTKEAIHLENVSYNSQSVVEYVSMTNMLVGANGQGVKPLSDNFAQALPSTFSHGLVADGANLPPDPTGAASNIVAEVSFMPGGYVPSRKSAAIDAACKLDYMADPRYRSMGNGTVEVVYQGNGVHVVPQGVRRKGEHTRIYGAGPDIGACEYYSTPGLLLLVR